MASHVHPISRKRKERDPTVGIEKAEPVAGDRSNRLLAGYLAHEFLTKGTLLGKPWPEPGRVEPVEVNRDRSTQTAKAYDEVAHLLKSDGVHVPGVVNPSQLGRWLRM